MTDRPVTDSTVPLEGLFDEQGAVGAIDAPRRRRRLDIWPETTPIAGLTPRLPESERPPERT